VAGPTVAELNVEINAETDGLKASVREAKSELEGVGKSAESSAKKGGDAFSKLGEGIEKQTAGVRKFTGALSSAVGVVTAIVGVFALLTAAIRNATAKQEAFIESSDKASDSLEQQAKKLRQVEAEYSDLGQTQITNAEEADRAISQINEGLEEQIGILSTIANAPTPLSGDLWSQIKESIKEQRGILSTTSDIYFKVVAGGPSFLLRLFGVKSADELTDQAEKAISEVNRVLEEVQTAQARLAKSEAEEFLRAQAEAIELSFLDETDKIREAAKIRKEELKRAAIEAGLEAENETLQAALEGINRRRDADIAAIEEARKIKEQADAEALQKKEQAEIESAQRAARAAREAFRSELEGVTEAIFGTGGNSFTTRLDTLVRGVSALRSEIRGLK